MPVAAASPLSLNLTFPVEVVVFLALLYLLSRYVFPPSTGRSGPANS